MRTTSSPARSFWLWLALFILVVFAAASSAAQAPAYAADGSVAQGRATSEIDLLVGRSTVLNVGAPIARVSLSMPDVADALVTSPQQILIHGKAPGTISLFVWDRAGAIRTYEVNVRRDLSALVEQLRQLFPGEPITVTGSGRDVVVAGTVSSKYVIDKAAEVAAGYVEKKENVVNLLKLQEGAASNQVLLRVRFAEVSRTALQELGASFAAHGFKDGRWFGRTTTQQFPAPEWDEQGRLVFSDFLNLFVFDSREGLASVIRALQSRGLFQSLAEPNVVATNGREASFLAGGEFPYPVAQVGAGGTAITIQFKEFGVRLNFTPTVLNGDLIHLKVRPEVSALDFANAVIVEGFRVPALTTRRAETEVELRDGQTFAIAGLLNNTATSQMRKIPGIGDIPILGLLFRSRAYQKDQTELVVMITPHILRRDSRGASEALPNLVEPFLGRPDRVMPPPAPYTGSPVYPTETQRRSGTSAEAPPPGTNAPAVPPAKEGPLPRDLSPVRAAEPAPAATPGPSSV
ncbi:MAG TPA: type II and III secretion system protein family protein, partial [Vicinamibacterales bacterium]|nr:type II and III secretion system protein family protein [Vicinamibacterales bacterium]